MISSETVRDPHPMYLVDQDDPVYQQHKILCQIHEDTENAIKHMKKANARDRERIRYYKKKKREFEHRLNGNKWIHRLKLLFLWDY